MTMAFAPGALSEDHFLGGRLKVLQPRTGYRAATDPVILAASIPARSGESVLELGCGVGVASLCLAVRVPGLRMTGVELQPDYAELARANAARNGLELEVFPSDITSLPSGLRARLFDHVIANPPWFRPEAPGAHDAGRAVALREATPLAEWIDTGLRRLRSGGVLTVIQLAERLPAVLAALDRRASACVLPLVPREGRDAGRVIVQARKGRRDPFRLLAPLVMHEGTRHDGDRESFTPQAMAILRNAGALDMGRVRESEGRVPVPGATGT